jgi:hypothetical protein
LGLRLEHQSNTVQVAMIYFVTGKLGSGKTLAAVGRIRDSINKGLPVATNLDLHIEKFRNKNLRNIEITRLPDKPSINDLNAIGIGNHSYDEDQNGLLVLDECGTWFNSRGWADKSRQPVIDWFLHARKLGWDVIFIVQDISLVDKQAREALAEMTVFCRRMDRLQIPFIGSITKLLFGKQLRLPKIHMGVVKYGDSKDHLTVDRWVYLGKDLYPLYDTKQVFVSGEQGIYQYLTPWHLVGRYQQHRTLSSYLNQYLVPVLATIAYPLMLLSEHAPWPRSGPVLCRRSTEYYVDTRTAL